MIVTVQRSDGKTFFNIQQPMNSSKPCLFVGSVEASWKIDTKDLKTSMKRLKTSQELGLEASRYFSLGYY